MKPKELHKFYLKRELTLANHESTYITDEELYKILEECLGKRLTNIIKISEENEN